MKVFCLIAAVAFSLCSGLASAESVVLHGKAGRVTEAITLRNAPPSSVMWGLGLFTSDDMESGNTQSWRADKAVPSCDPRPTTVGAPSASLTAAMVPGLKAIMAGIDMVVPRDNEHVLMVYGEKAAVAEFKSMAALLDVVPKQVQVKTEIIRIGPEDEKKLDLEKLCLAGISKSQAAEVGESLRNAGAEFVSSPTISSISGVPGEISVSSEPYTWRLREIARVNADNTITLVLRPCVSEPKMGRTQELFTQRRIADGESVLLGGFRCGEPTKDLLFLMTAKIVSETDVVGAPR